MIKHLGSKITILNNNTKSSTCIKKITRYMHKKLVIGALWWTRTTDPRFRKPMLYPAELRAQNINLKCIYSMNLIFKKEFFANY